MATEIKILLYFFVLMALTFPWSMRFLVKTGVKLLDKIFKSYE
jgi:hypothetical protein